MEINVIQDKILSIKTTDPDDITAVIDRSKHVAEEEVVLLRVPDRPLGEGEASRQPLDRRPLLHELVDRVRLGVDTRHCDSPFLTVMSARR